MTVEYHTTETGKGQGLELFFSFFLLPSVISGHSLFCVLLAAHSKNREILKLVSTHKFFSLKEAWIIPIFQTRKLSFKGVSNLLKGRRACRQRGWIQTRVSGSYGWLSAFHGQGWALQEKKAITLKEQGTGGGPGGGTPGAAQVGEGGVPDSDLRDQSQVSESQDQVP